MAISPLPIPAMPGAMDALTAQMAGLTAEQAYDRYMDKQYEGGNDLKIGYTTITTETSAITGDSSDTISGNTNPDPVDAWNDYVENEPDGISRVSGGIVSGSNSTTMAYSILKNTNNDPEAVVPVGIPIDVAIVSVAQTLGVSIDAAQLDVETKQKFANSIVQGTEMIYDKARDLVLSWKDSLGNILFPKSVVDAVNDVLEEEGIGGSAGYDVNTSKLQYPNHYPLPLPTVSSGSYHEFKANRHYYWDFVVTNGIGVSIEDDTAYRLYVFSTNSGRVGSYKDYFQGQTSDWYALNTQSSVVTHDGKRIYYHGRVGYKNFYVSGPPSQRVTQPYSIEDLATIIYDGHAVGEYPEGTSESEAPSYTPSELIQKGIIMGADSAQIPVVLINIPDDPYNSTGSTKDPQDPTADDNPGVLNPGYPGSIPDTRDPGGDNTKEGNVPIPLPIPDTRPSNPDVPITDSSVINSTLINELVEELATTLDPQPVQSSGFIPIPPMPGIPNIDPDTGLPDGTVTFPSVIPDSGPGFIHVYNPTPAEFVSFGTWLWVTYADATIDKILNNPFDGVIGAHELYATPNRGGRDNIRSAFLTCPTTADLVPNRYSEIDCGTVIVPEFYGNYLDYSPYSQAYIYLPFIGINEVSIDDIVGHAVNIRYRVDSYSGACIAMIFVAKGGYQNLCYQFAGSCSVEVPMAGGSQAAIKAAEMQAEAYARAAMVSAGGHLLGGIGSALMGSLGGAISGVAGIAGDYANAKAGVEAARVANKSSVQHSGQFGASHGAMGEKIPFIIIRNPIQVKVVNYNDDYGYPAHKRVIIGGCTGYLRVREVNVISAHATDDEKAAIEALLKNGVYVS